MAKQLHPAPLILMGREPAEVARLPHAQGCLSSSLAALQTATSLSTNCCAYSVVCTVTHKGQPVVAERLAAASKPYLIGTPPPIPHKRCMTTQHEGHCHQSCCLLGPVKASAAVEPQMCELAQDVGSMQVDQHGLP